MNLQPTPPKLLKIEKDWDNQSITFRQLQKRLAAIGWEPTIRRDKVVGWHRIEFSDY